MGWSLQDLISMAQKGTVDNKDKSFEYNILNRLQEL
jgi:hypothetical protein